MNKYLKLIIFFGVQARLSRDNTSIWVDGEEIDPSRLLDAVCDAAIVLLVFICGYHLLGCGSVLTSAR